MTDEPKRLANLDKHGLDFASLTADFFAGATVVRAKLSRLKAIATWQGEPVTVIFTPLGREAISVISMRPADKKERALLQWRR